MDSRTIASGGKKSAIGALLALTLTVWGCGTVQSSPSNPTGGSVTIAVDPPSATVQVSTTKKFNAVVSNSANPAVAWQVNGLAGGDAVHGTIDATGMYTAPAAVPTPASVTITAIAQAQSTAVDTAVVTIVTAPPVVSISVSPTSASLQVGRTQNITATLQNDDQNKGVNWALSGAGCSGATCGTLSAASSASGVAIVYTAPAAVPSPATVTLTATSVADTSKTAAATFTITAAPVPVSVAVTPTSVSVQGDKAQSFSATVQNDGLSKGVTWALTGAGCSGATCGTLSASSSPSGVAITYTAPTTVPTPAAVTLTAKSVTDTTKSAAAAITVTAPPPVAVTVNPTTASVQTSKTQSIAATVSNDTQNKGVTWTLTGAGCSGATCGTLSAASSASGAAITYTAPATVPAPATVTLTAQSVTDTTKSAAATFTITPPPPIAVAVIPTTASVQTTKTQSISATLSNDTQNKGVTWALTGAGCSGATCGTLSAASSASGVAITYTAPATVPAPATVTLTAQSVSDTTKSAAAAFTITPPPPIAVAVNPTTATVQTSKTQSISATVTNDTQNKGVTWALSGAGCSGATCGTLLAASSASGAATTYTAPATVPAPATVTLTAQSVTDTTKSAAATFTITPPPPIAVAVNPTTATVQTNKTQTISATVTNDAQNQGVTWALTGAGCSGATCGTLSAASSPSGTAITYTAPAAVPAPATVTLTAQSVTDTTKTAAATFTVVPPPPVSVTVNPTAASIQTNNTQNIVATVGNDPQNKGVTWTLSGAGCGGATCGALSAASSASGASIIYTAPAAVPTPATVTLTAQSVADTTKTAAATFTVVPPPPIGVAVNPTTASLQTNNTQSVIATVSNDTQNKGVTWTLTGAGCSGATCGTLSATSSAAGAAITYTAPAAVPAPAIVTLTAQSVADTTKTAVLTITVVAPPPVILTANPTTVSVQTNNTQSVSATVQNDPQNKGVTWTLTGAGCSGATCGTLSATSSASGVAITYTAPATAPAPATVTLTAQSVADTSKSTAVTITITSVPVTVSVSPKRAGLTTGQPQTFAATVGGTANTAVTWEVDTIAGGNSSIGTISAAGVYTPPSTAGTHTVGARSVVDSTVTGTASVAITDLAGVFTYHNDLSRDGANIKEYALNTSTVKAATFGKRFACGIDASAYAQPLWVANVNIGGTKHNVLIAATQHDTVYAFDADASPCQTLWSKSLLASGETWVSSNDVGTTDITPDIGIVGTPVIDPGTQTLYVVSKSKNGSTFHQRLHALSLVDGSEKFSGPQEIAFTSGGITFSPLRQNERCGLALVNGVVYIAYASHGDNPTYYGWVVGYNATTLALTGVFNDDPGPGFGGIWMAGGAPAADSSNNLFMITGNGNFDGSTQFGDSFLKLSTAGGNISLSSFFSPNNQASLNANDTDLGSGGAAILVDLPSGPAPRLVVGGGKGGTLYLLNRDSLGGNTSNDSGPLQIFPPGNQIFSTPAFWQNTLYLTPMNDHTKSYAFSTASGTFALSPFSQSPGTYGFPGATPSISSQGASNGIVWAIERISGSASVLHAFDATNLATELWNSKNNSADQAGQSVKFTVPTVANGKVYVGTAGEISIYGLSPN